MKKRIFLIIGIYLSVPVIATLFGLVSMLTNHSSLSDIFFGSLLTFTTFLFFPLLVIGFTNLKESVFAIPAIFLIALLIFLFKFARKAISK